MERWKATALVLGGALMGMVYAAACGVGAQAAPEAGAGRTVVYLEYDATGLACRQGSLPTPGCCPDGFTAVGSGSEGVVCLED